MTASNTVVYIEISSMVNVYGHNLLIQWVNSEDTLDQLIRSLHDHCFVAVDTETYADISPDYPSINSLLLQKAKLGGLNPHLSKIRLIQFYPFHHKYRSQLSENNVVYIIDYQSFQCKYPEATEILKQCLFNHRIFNVTWVGHNIKFDLTHLIHAGFQMHTYDFKDTMLVSKLFNAGKPEFFRASLDECVKRAFGIELDKTYQVSDWSPYAMPIIDEHHLKYAAADVFFTAKLYQSYLESCNRVLNNLPSNHNKYREIVKLMNLVAMEGACSLATADMELNGFRIDLQRFADYAQEVYDELRAAYVNLMNSLPPTWFNVESYYENNKLKHELVGKINLNSTQDILGVLKRYGIKNPETGELIDTTDKKVLSQINHPAVKALLNYRNKYKIYSTYVEPFKDYVNPITKRIHSTFNQMGADTGRFSSTSPNLQNIPRTSSFRQLFTAEPGNKLIVADYSQIEVRISAQISKDRELISIFKEGVDLYKSVASKINDIPYENITKELRQQSKAVVLGFQYGMGAKKFMAYYNGGNSDEIDLEQSQQIRDSFFSKFTGLAQWHNRVKQSLNGDREFVPAYSLFGRRRIFTNDGKLSFSSLVNSPVQSTSADITKYALILLHQYLELINSLCLGYRKNGCEKRSKFAMLVNCVHDEIIIEAAEDIAEAISPLISCLMTLPARDVMPDVPVLVEASAVDSWAEK